LEETGLLSQEQKNPTQELLFARRMVEDLVTVEIIEDLNWDPLLDKWVLLCRLSSNYKSTDVVPESTNWYVHIEDEYPWGDIKFYPAKMSGLKGTFPHQNYNGDTDSIHPWTNGNICLDTSFKKFRQLGLDDEPYDAESRLLWHFERALIWLRLAASESLSNPGDPFELPHFNHELHTVVNSEDYESFFKWKSTKQHLGLAEFLFYNNQKKEPYVIVPTNFLSIDGKKVCEPKWGKGISDLKNDSEIFTGAWIMLNKIPFVMPWQAPITWGELREASAAQGIALMERIRRLSTTLRDGKSHIFLIGFPIPERVNGNPKQIHWQPLLLPKLSNVRGKVKGFRDTEKFNWLRDSKKIFKDNNKILWLNSENWHDGELFNRGKLKQKVRTSSILQLGAGAVGSILSELLVRSGQKEITIMDDDLLEAGNIVRNTLTLEDVLQFKVDKLQDRLHKISPHSNVQTFKEKFPPKNEQFIDWDKFDIILDCTGEDETLFNLSKIIFEEPKTVVSISLGYEARRLFVFHSNSRQFNHAAFVQLIQPWLEKEKSETEYIEFPREGMGCWHPIFPARADDVWLMVSTAFKSIERAILGDCNKPKLFVYEHQWDGDLFKGITLVNQEVYND
jgi:hypothetical protein